jgi:S-adenosylmethionine synthetase
VECAVSSAIVFIAARFASTSILDFSRIARKVIQKIGFDQPDFNAKTCSILNIPQEKALDDRLRFDEKEMTDKDIEKIAAKNQVTVFGFACDQTPVLMPLPIYLAHKLARRMDEVRRSGILPYLTPDGKTQVGVVYKNRKPVRIHSISLEACQKDSAKPLLRTLKADIKKQVINQVFSDEPMGPDKKTEFFINPEGQVLVGGPSHHSGLTGRKSGVDTYGEFSRHSGKALSGKDPLRIDRIAAYAARYAAKNVVAAGLADRCEIALSYSTGLSRPVSLQVETFGTGKIEDAELAKRIKERLEFRPAGILKNFDLRRLPIYHHGGFYQKLAAYGHFGRQDLDLPWENTDNAQILVD